MAITATYVDTNTFTVTTDRTTEFVVGRRVLCDCGVDGYNYGTIISSSYSDPNTTVNLSAGSENLTANLVSVLYGIQSEGILGSVPIHNHDGSEGSGGSVTGSAHTITSHSDITDATGAQLEELTGGGDTTLHDHDGISENTAARHAESHSIASHSDTTATGAELETLTDNSIADTLHRHSELVASDGSPDPALSIDADGKVGIGISTPSEILHLKDTSYVSLILEGGASNASGIYFKNPNINWAVGYNTDDSLTITDVTNIHQAVKIISNTCLISLVSGTGINEFSTDGTLAGDSDDAVPTEKATKTYVDANTDLVNDSSPQLGADLECNSHGINMGDQILDQPKIRDYGESVNALGSLGGGSDAINIQLGNVVTATVDTAAQTFTFTNPSASGTACSFTLILTNGGSQTVNWPASVDWEGGTAPTLTSSGIDILTFITVDGGTIWYGFTAGLEMS